MGLIDFIIWVVTGILAGFIASKFVGGKGKGWLVDLLLGILGSIIGGWLFNALGINLGIPFASIITAVIGAIIVLWIWNKIK